MNLRSKGRLVRLEQTSRPMYASYIGLLLRKWPDQMIEAFICGELGMGLGSLGDGDLRALLSECDQVAALE